MSEDTKRPSVRFADLLLGFEAGNAGYPDEIRSFIDLGTGEVRWISADRDIGDETETEIEENGDIPPLPNKYDLNLGKRLVFAFADSHMSEADAEKAYSFFDRKGGYRRFKDFLDRRSMLQAWYDFEEAATRQALRAWCEAEGVTLDRDAAEHVASATRPALSRKAAGRTALYGCVHAPGSFTARNRASAALTAIGCSCAIQWPDGTTTSVRSAQQRRIGSASRESMVSQV